MNRLNLRLRNRWKSSSFWPHYDQLEKQLKYRLRRTPFLGPFLIKAKLIKRYRLDMGLQPRLSPPVSFNEHVLHRILYDRDPRLKIICDKLAVREWIRSRIGDAYLVPLLGTWIQPAQIDWHSLPDEVVLKTNHASGPVLLLDGTYRQHVSQWLPILQRWMSFDYFDHSGEWGYRNLPRRLMAEPRLKGADGGAPPEAQVMTFFGKAVFIRIFTGGKETPEFLDNWFDREGNRLALRVQAPVGDFVLPRETARMLCEISEQVAAGFDHLRVDFYLTAEGLNIGELTAYHCGAHQHWEPPEMDIRLGRLWREPSLSITDALK